MLSETGSDWVSTSAFLVRVSKQADLFEINWNAVHNQTVSHKNLDTQRKLKAKMTENIKRLSRWVCRQNLSEEEKTILRSMYRQYHSAVDAVTRNIEVVTAFLAMSADDVHREERARGYTYDL
jgi:hypothetical protein